MVPIALINTVRRGLILYRKIIRAKNYYDKAKDIFEAADLALFSDEESHRYVLGEEAFFFVLGDGLIKQLTYEEVPNPDTVTTILLSSIKRFRDSRTTIDATGAIADFAHILGQELQTAIPSTDETIRSYFRQDKFVVSDPVADYFRSTPTLTHALRTFLHLFDITDQDWKRITTSFAAGDPDVTITGEGGEPASAATVHRYTTLMGLVLRGASSILEVADPFMTVLKGVDGLALNAISLTLPRPQIRPKEYLPTDRTITSEMSSAMSKRILARKGYVFTLEKEWAHISEVEDAEIEVAGGKKITGKTRKYSVGLEQTPAELESRDSIIRRGLEQLIDLAYTVGKSTYKRQSSQSPKPQKPQS